MPNHVHLVVVPASEDGLRRGIGEAHRRYTRRVNFRQRWREHLWQGRFASSVLDDDYLRAATPNLPMSGRFYPPGDSTQTGRKCGGALTGR
jgi:putative transposase